MAAQGSGSIVNVSSISALRGDGTIAYSAAKGALLAMTVDMAYSHGRQGIRVNAVAPGHITTPMVLSVSNPGPRAEFMNRMREEAGLLGTPGTGWDVAWAVAFLASDEARWITGVTLPVESGVLSVAPLMMAPHLRAIPEPDDVARRGRGRLRSGSTRRPEVEWLQAEKAVPTVSEQILFKEHAT